MDTFGNAILGLVFWGLGFANTILMYKLWGYPFDTQRLRSSAPPRLLLLHRLSGYLFLLVYLYFMSQMIPRLFNYQVEFPARTVVHLTLGLTIGMILLLKILIVRYFKYLVGELVPLLGTSLLICTTLVIGLSVPFALRDRFLAASVVSGGVFSEESKVRLAGLLPLTDLPDEAPLEDLSSDESLQRGRNVLTGKCVQCHDLRTILLRPKTPQSWYDTVRRMSDRSLILDPIQAQEQWAVTAYLVAISPQLQRSSAERRHEQLANQSSRLAAETAIANVSRATAGAEFDQEEARALFQMNCSLCHSLTKIEETPPRSETEVHDLIERMAANGLIASEDEIQKITQYLIRVYADS